MLGIDSSIPVKQLTTPVLLELVTLEFLTPNSLIVSLAYIPPNSSTVYITTFFDYIRSLYSSHCSSNLLLLGDFNFPDIDWQTLYGSSPLSSLFCDLIFDFNLVQVIDFPTHNKGIF